MFLRATVRAMLAAAAVVVLSAQSAPGNAQRLPPSDRDDPTRFVGGVALGGAEALNTRRPADYLAMRQANATWVRSDLDWRWLEETRAHWNWNLYDPVVADATAAGLSFVAILHTVPDWANGGAGAYAPPEDLSLLTNYCYQTSRHYIPLGVTTYEIGNEVNLPHPGWLAPTGAMYTRDLLVPCVTGVRQAAAELGTSVNVLLGSLVPTDRGAAAPVTFLSDVYANGGQGRFDNASMHPYTGPEGPAASDHLTTYAERLHDVMTSYGDGAKKIWATEIGYPTGGADSVTEQQQAEYVNLAIDLWYANSFAGPLFWYSARDTGTNPNNREAHYGVLRNDGSPKPAYSALAARLTR
jgi:polysaccharide biosynthesis protein PslG